MLLLISLLLCACAHDLPGGANKAPPTHLVYETYADAGRYLFNPSPQNWTDASKVCRSYNGHLAYPKTQDEADMLWSIMTRYNVNQVHAGFHDQFVEGEYYTAKGRLLNEITFNKWSSGAPVGGSTLNCGGLRGDGLVDVACKDIYPSICEEDDLPDNGGFLDYEYIEGHGYYKINEAPTPWPEAMKICYDHGAHLLILNSEAELDAVFNRFHITDTAIVIWVGVHHRHADKYFVTIFDDALEATGYTTWSNNEPAGSNLDFPYVAVRLSGLITLALGTTFICEYNPSN